MSKIFLGIMIVMIVLWTFILLNFTYIFLNQKIINNNWKCIAIGFERMNGEPKKEEHCSCLYRSYELAKNPFRELWDNLYKPFNRGIESEQFWEIYNECKR